MHRLLLLLTLVLGGFSGPRSLSGVPDMTLTPHMTSVDVAFFRLYPDNAITDYTLAIHKGTDNTGDEMCSQPFTCPDIICTISSDTICDPLPACTDIFVEVLGYVEVMTGSTKTLCELTTTTTMSTPETTSTTRTKSTETSTSTSTSTTTTSTTTTPEISTSTSTSTTTTASTTATPTTTPSSASKTTTDELGATLSCFYCSDDEEGFNYDPECGLYGYDGNSDTSHSYKSCYVTVWNGGSKVVRAMTTATSEDGFCDDLGDRMTCYCNTNDCNYGLCDHCFPDHTTTTRHPTQPTLPPGTGLECYACVDCQTVTADTPTAVSQDYQSCFTSIIAESATRQHLVIRGGDEVPHVDGDCRHEDGAFICYCSTNLCNHDPAK